MPYKFSPKQTVTYSPALPGSADRNARFEVVRRLPSEHGVNHYRLKSLQDGHERVAMESELS